MGVNIKKIQKDLRWRSKADVNKKEFKTVLSQLTRQGYTLVSTNNYQAILKMPKKFNWGVFILLTLFLNIFGLIGYIIYYNVKKGGKEVILNKI